MTGDTYSVPALCADGGGLRNIEGSIVHHGSLSFSPTTTASADPVRSKPGTASAMATISIYLKPGNFIKTGASAKIVDYLDFVYLVGKATTDWNQAASDPFTDLDEDGNLEFDDVAEFGKLYGE